MSVSEAVERVRAAHRRKNRAADLLRSTREAADRAAYDALIADREYREAVEDLAQAALLEVDVVQPEPARDPDEIPF